MLQGGIGNKNKFYFTTVNGVKNEQYYEHLFLNLNKPFSSITKNSPPKPEGLCCMKVCYIRHEKSIRLDQASITIPNERI